MKYLAIFSFFSLFIGSAFSGTGPCNGSGCNSPIWSAPALVKEINSSLSAQGGYLFEYFRIINSECAIGTSGGGTPQLVVLGSDALAIVRMQAMRSTMLTAFSTGSLVRVKWVGNYCWADDVMICSDVTCTVFN